MWVKSNPNHKIINKAIYDKIHEAQEYISQLPFDSQISSGIVQQKLKGGFSPSFFDYAENVLEKRYQNTKSIKYNKMIKTTLTILKQFLNGSDLLFVDLNVSFLSNFEAYLKERGNKTNTIHSTLKRMRAIINEAVRENIIEYDRNPFLKFRLKLAPTSKEKLSIDEIVKIENLDLVNGSLIWHVRNYFLFSFYAAGVRASDCIKLKWSNISEVEIIEKGKKVTKKRLKYDMSKNSKNQNIILVDQAVAIIKHYERGDVKGNDFIFPLIPNGIKYTELQLFNKVSSINTIINKNLKLIALKADIKKKLSFSLSRHSFADFLRKKGENIHTIKMLMNHSNVRTTEIYVASLDNEVKDNALIEAFSK